MALTPDQVDIVKAKIAELYQDIGNLTVAKQEVYPADDLEDINDLNTSQYDSFDDEIGSWDGEYGYLIGRTMIPTDFVTQSDIDEASLGEGRMFPAESAEVIPTRNTGEGDGSATFIDNESLFTPFVLPGDSVVTSLHGIFTVQNVVDDHTLTVDPVVPVDTVIGYRIDRVLYGNPYLYLRPYIVPGLKGGSGWNPSAEEINISAEQPLLSWFYWPVPPEFLPGPVPNPAYDTYVENVNAFADALDSEINSLQGQLDSWSDGGGGWKYNFDTTQAYTDIVAALANAQTFKANMDLDGSGDITIADFKFLNADTIMPPLLSSRDTFLTGTRTPQVSNREAEITTALGSIVETGESFTGSGLYYNRYNWLTMLVDRANGTNTAVKSREVDTSNIDNQIAFKERQITEYEVLL